MSSVGERLGDHATLELVPAVLPGMTLVARSPDGRYIARQQGPDLEVRLNDDPALGFCIFAMRSYKPGDILYSERTALEATHDVYPQGPREVYHIYQRYSDGRKKKLHGAFPHLAWANNVDPHEAADCRNLITSNVIDKTVDIEVRLTAADHIRMRPDSALVFAKEAANAPSSGSGDGASVTAGEPVPAAPYESPVARAISMFSSLLAPITKLPIYGLESEDPNAAANAALAAAHSLPPPATKKKAKEETTAWFSRYAFRLLPEHTFPETGKHHRAAVYLLTDLINHRCKNKNNCRVRTEVGKITLVADKPIEAGEEITIDYKKEVKDFVCRAECCAPPPAPA